MWVGNERRSDLHPRIQVPRILSHFGSTVAMRRTNYAINLQDQILKGLTVSLPPAETEAREKKGGLLCVFSKGYGLFKKENG